MLYITPFKMVEFGFTRELFVMCAEMVGLGSIVELLSEMVGLGAIVELFGEMVGLGSIVELLSEMVGLGAIVELFGEKGWTRSYCRTIQWRIQDFPNGGALFCHKWGGTHPVFQVKSA